MAHGGVTCVASMDLRQFQRFWIFLRISGPAMCLISAAKPAGNGRKTADFRHEGAAPMRHAANRPLVDLSCPASSPKFPGTSCAPKGHTAGCARSEDELERVRSQSRPRTAGQRCLQRWKRAPVVLLLEAEAGAAIGRVRCETSCCRAGVKRRRFVASYSTRAGRPCRQTARSLPSRATARDALAARLWGAMELVWSVRGTNDERC